MTLVIADHPVTPEELADVRALLTADVTDHVCSCPCGCCRTEIGGGICRTCESGDHLWPEAVRR